MRDLQALQHGAHPFNRAKRGEKRCPNSCSQLGQELLRNRASQGLIVIDDRRRASPEEQIERLVETKMDAVARQHLRKAAATQYLAIDQYAIAVENDKVGLGHRIPPAE